MNARKIIIADDEAYIRSLLASRMTQLGDCVWVAADGEEAFNLACEHQPDLIITDFQMPVLSGFNMALQLKEDPRTARIPVLMLTARGHQLTPTQLATTNIRCVVAKPFSARELVVKVEELIGPPPNSAARAA